MPTILPLFASTMADAMAVLRWQWTLANGAAINAVVDTVANTEAVLQGTRILSQSLRGAKPDGHAVIATPETDHNEETPPRSERPPIEAILKFEPLSPICILRVDDHEVAPTLWPVKERSVPTVQHDRPIGGYVLIGLLLVAILGVGIFFVSRRGGGDGSVSGTKLDATYRASNGLFIAHYPNDLGSPPPPSSPPNGFEGFAAPRGAILPLTATGIILEDKSRWRTIVIGAMPLDGPTSPSSSSIPRDPWALQQRLHDEALVNVPKGDGRYDETARRDETCIGERGAVIVGTITKTSGERGRIWSCAFVHQSAAYIVMYMLAEPAGSSADSRGTLAEERRLRAIIDATELTQLADLGPGDLAIPSIERR